MLEKCLMKFKDSQVSIYTGEVVFNGKLEKIEDGIAVISNHEFGEIYIRLDDITAFHKEKQKTKNVGFLAP